MNEFKVTDINVEILEMIETHDEKIAVLWAKNCAILVLDLYQEKYPNDPRLSDAFLKLDAWLLNKLPISTLRKFAFQAHDAARTAKSKQAMYAARACGHALATVHVKKHAVYAANYAILALQHSKRKKEAKSMLQYQYDQLMRLIKGEESE